MKILHIEKALFGMVMVLALGACKGEGGAGGGSTTSASGDKVGVAECDEYLTKYEKCLKDKVPEAARGAMEGSMKQMRDGWKQVASDPQGKAALAGACKQALDAAKTAMGSYGCSW